MSDLECELEVMAYLEAQDILRGKGKKLPSAEFVKKLQELQQMQNEASEVNQPSVPSANVPRPVTPKELGY